MGSDTRHPRADADEMARRARMHDAWVEFVANMMRNLLYSNSKTAKHCAEIWNVPEGWARKIAVEASRKVRAEITEPDLVLSKVATALDQVIDTAIASGDTQAVISAAKTYAQVTGAGAAQRVQISGDLSSLTPEQLAAKKAEILAKLQATEKPKAV